MTVDPSLGRVDGAALALALAPILLQRQQIYSIRTVAPLAGSGL
jgi:hypothetical protein